MENLMAWFKDNKECLTVFENPKEKKAAIISNMITQLVNECTCYTCRRAETIDTFTNENLINLINFISENNKILICKTPNFEYKDSIYFVSERLFTTEEFMELVNSQEEPIFVYIIRENKLRGTFIQDAIEDVMVYVENTETEKKSDKFLIRFAQQNNKLKN